MTRDDIIRMARKAGLKVGENISGFTLIGSPLPMGLAHIDIEEMQRFAALFRDYLLSTEIHSCHDNCQRFACVQTRKAVEAEREKVAAWMTERSYATGHGDTTEDLLKELEWQVRESEREACAKVCEESGASYVNEWNKKLGVADDLQEVALECAHAIRARGNK